MLRSGSPEDIRVMFDQMNTERKNLLTTIVRLVYFMRGAIQYQDMFEMSPVERDAVAEFIEKRLEAEANKAFQNY